MKFLTEQEGIAQRRCFFGRVRTGEDVGELLAIAIDGARAPRRAQENLTKCEMILGPEAPDWT